MAPSAADTHIDLTPPKGVAQAATRGLRLRQTHGRGGTAIGVARARDLAAQRTLSVQTLRRMHSYFARHRVDQQGKGWADRKAPSAGYIAWLLWGGDAGQRWAERVLQRLATTAKKAATSKTAMKKATPRKAATKKATAKGAATKPKSIKKTATKKTAAKKTSTKNAAAKRASAKQASTKKGRATQATSVSKTAPSAKQTPPWKRPAPKRGKRSSTLSPAQKAQAKRRAEAAGRRYPNLVDNMAVAKRSRARGAS
ncbi:hypothetical protein [Xanthomonas maliensis]|uniref:hypothetical protein n=1 Tax=Xanthomonas maliensis TaxID=1321368 RepID=UPI00039A04C1|nr:hypothetical protein [Xanthomonas maliensis]KAB7763192.1 DNA-binding protein [Xanthomonas maliensis]